MDVKILNIVLAKFRDLGLHKGGKFNHLGTKELLNQYPNRKNEILECLNWLVDREVLEADTTFSEIYPDYRLTALGELMLYHPELLDICSKEIEVYLSLIDSIEEIIKKGKNPYDYILRLCLNDASPVKNTDVTILHQAIIQLVDRYKK